MRGQGIAVSYFNLVYNERGPEKLVHVLNRRYELAQLFEIRAPDAAGEIRIWARDEQEAREHLVNAAFDLIFRPIRVGAWANSENPPCIACGSKTQRGGRNSAGTRVWNCTNKGCQRKFVLDRAFRGGINHPSQSKKPVFARLVLSGVPPVEAATQIGLNIQTAKKWAAQVAAANPDRFATLACRCGKPMRHRGICLYRYTTEGRERVAAARRRRTKAEAPGTELRA